MTDVNHTKDTGTQDEPEAPQTELGECIRSVQVTAGQLADAASRLSEELDNLDEDEPETMRCRNRPSQLRRRCHEPGPATRNGTGKALPGRKSSTSR